MKRRFRIRAYRASGRMVGSTFHTGLSSGPNQSDPCRAALHNVAEALAQLGLVAESVAAHKEASHAAVHTIFATTERFRALLPNGAA